jgi:hypothetical protein
MALAPPIESFMELKLKIMASLVKWSHAKSESCSHKGCVEGGEENSGFTQVHLALVGHA